MNKLVELESYSDFITKCLDRGFTASFADIDMPIPNVFEWGPDQSPDSETLDMWDNACKQASRYLMSSTLVMVDARVKQLEKQKSAKTQYLMALIDDEKKFTRSMKIVENVVRKHKTEMVNKYAARIVRLKATGCDGPLKSSSDRPKERYKKEFIRQVETPDNPHSWRKHSQKGFSRQGETSPQHYSTRRHSQGFFRRHTQTNHDNYARDSHSPLDELSGRGNNFHSRQMDIHTESYSEQQHVKSRWPNSKLPTHGNKRKAAAENPVYKRRSARYSDSPDECVMTCIGQSMCHKQSPAHHRYNSCHNRETRKW